MDETKWRKEAMVAVQLLGELRLWIGREEISLTRKSRSKQLLAYLALPNRFVILDHPPAQALRRIVPRADLMRDLWSEDSGLSTRTVVDDQARLRRLLDDLGKLSSSTGITLATALSETRYGVSLNAAVDVDTLLAALDTAREHTEPVARTRLLVAALALFPCELLPEMEAPWIWAARRQLATLYADAFLELIPLLLQEKLPSLTARAAQLARDRWTLLSPSLLTMTQYPIYALPLMRLFLAAGRPRDALAAYATLEQALQADGQEPTSSTQALSREALDTLEKQRDQLRTVAAHEPPALLGREAELTYLESLIRKQHSLITLTGPPGVGKTRLAEECALRQIRTGERRVHLVRLQDITEPQQVPEAVLRVLEGAYRGSDIVDQILRALSAAPSLLVLDNTEHLLAGEETVAQFVNTLVTRVPGLVCLVTSQTPLKREGEMEVRLEPLSVPDETSREQTIRANVSVQLFVQQAQRVRRSFVLSSEDLSALARLCRLLDGLPLAITLMAGWSETHSPRHILAELDTLRSQTAPRAHKERYPSLSMVLRGSYERLRPEQAGMLRRLAVFRGGWTLPTAAAVCQMVEGEAGTDCLIGELVDRSLIEVDTEGEAPLRFRLLETVRMFAGEQLMQAGEEAQARAAHAHYYRERVTEISSGLRGPKQGEALAALRVEQENIRAALHWCLKEQGDTKAGAQMAVDLQTCFELSGSLQEGQEWYMLALQGLDALENSSLRASVHTALGTMLWKQSDLVAARTQHEQALELYDTTENESGVGIALHNLGLIASNLGDYEEALRLYAESLRIRHALGEECYEATLLINIASTTQQKGDNEGAAALLLEALPLVRRVSTPAVVGSLLTNLGNIRAQQKQYSAAHILYEEALRIQRELDNRPRMAILLSNLAQLNYDSGQYAASHRCLVEGLPLAFAVGDKDTASCTLMVCVLLACIQKDWLRAARLCGAVAALRERIGAAFPAVYQSEWENTQQAVQEALGEAVFASHVTIGQLLQEDALLALALRFDLPA